MRRNPISNWLDAPDPKALEHRKKLRNDYEKRYGKGAPTGWAGGWLRNAPVPTRRDLLEIWWKEKGAMAISGMTLVIAAISLAV